jgi:hypothetical protein
MCPIETPEGPNIGLIGSLSSYGRVNAFGFVQTPYRKVRTGKVTSQIDYLTADEDYRHVIAQANAPVGADGTFVETSVLVRRKGGEVAPLSTPTSPPQPLSALPNPPDPAISAPPLRGPLTLSPSRSQPQPTYPHPPHPSH